MEESKLDDLFSCTINYSFDPLKSVIRILMDRMNNQDKQLAAFKELGDRFQRYSSLDKLVESRLVFLEQLTTQQTKQLLDIKSDHKKMDSGVKVAFEKLEGMIVIRLIVLGAIQQTEDRLMKIQADESSQTHVEIDQIKVKLNSVDLSRDNLEQDVKDINEELHDCKLKVRQLEC